MNLPDVPLPLPLPARVQLQMANGTCFEARYDASDVLVSDGAQFKGKSPP